MNPSLDSPSGGASLLRTADSDLIRTSLSVSARQSSPSNFQHLARIAQYAPRQVENTCCQAAITVARSAANAAGSTARLASSRVK